MALERTPLFDTHVAAGAKMVDFGGWEMPLHYGSQIEEHHAVRRAAGMFDVSHMTIIDLDGSQALDFLRHLTANDPARLSRSGPRAIRRAAERCRRRRGRSDRVPPRGGEYRAVVNAATREKCSRGSSTTPRASRSRSRPRPDLAMIAVQGPQRDRAVRSASPAFAARPK